jgi:hypothetical protein
VQYKIKDLRFSPQFKLKIKYRQLYCFRRDKLGFLESNVQKTEKSHATD